MSLFIIIIIIVVIILISLFINNMNYEYMTTLNNDAIQNLSSVYNKDRVRVTNGTIKKLTVNGMFDLLPKGVIVAWNGTKDNIPKGWALCDGSNNDIPNLADRFILGWGDKNINNTGGNETATLDQSHLPAHAHNFSYYSYQIKNDFGGINGNNNFLSPNEINQTYNTTSAGSSQPFSIMPPYDVLTYIIKL